MSVFLDLSCIVAFICLYRIVAVMQPRKYKTLAHYGRIVFILSCVMTTSSLIAAILVVFKVLDYRYLGPPHSVGCTLYLAENFYYAYISVFIILVLILNVILVLTYLTLNNKLKQVLNTSIEVQTMKKGARFVTSITATCYFVCYTPTVVAYIILSVRPEIMSGLEPPYALIVDFLLRILSHLNSCVLPLCLVTGKTLNRLQLAAKITRRSTIRLKESSDP